MSEAIQTARRSQVPRKLETALVGVGRPQAFMTPTAKARKGPEGPSQLGLFVHGQLWASESWGPRCTSDCQQLTARSPLGLVAIAP